MPTVIDELTLTGRVRAVLSKVESVAEIPMFGGIGFMLNGNLLVATSRRGLLVRVGKEQEASALAHPGAILLEMRGRPMAGYIRIPLEAIGGSGAVAAWVQMATAFVAALPPKATAAKKTSAKQGRKKPR